MLDSGFYMAPTAQWEFASSPVIHDGTLVIQADVQKGSFIAAFDVATGKELWRTPRQDVPTWSTPTMHMVGGKPQILVNGWKHTGAYDLATGKEIWKLNGGGDIPVPVPVVGHGLVFITNAHGPRSPIYAIRETATGDISLTAGATTNDHIAWSVPRDGAYLISPVLYRDLLYVDQEQRRVQRLRREDRREACTSSGSAAARRRSRRPPSPPTARCTSRAKKATSTW